MKVTIALVARPAGEIKQDPDGKPIQLSIRYLCDVPSLPDGWEITEAVIRKVEADEGDSDG